MTYNATKYSGWRSLKVSPRLALALADDSAPKTIPAVLATIADIPTPGSATAPTCAAKINELLASLRSAGYLAP
jgi:hypothetical protein